jgi:hypothetical protein
MGDALAELLADITEGARTIGTLLQTTNGDRKRRTARIFPQPGVSAKSHCSFYDGWQKSQSKRLKRGFKLLEL